MTIAARQKFVHALSEAKIPLKELNALKIKIYVEKNLCSADLEKFVLDPGFPIILTLYDACIDEIEGAKSKERERLLAERERLLAERKHQLAEREQLLSQLKNDTVYYKYDNDETEDIVQLTPQAFKTLVKKNHNTILSENRRVIIHTFESIVDWIDFSANPPIVIFVQSELELEHRSTSRTSPKTPTKSRITHTGVLDSPIACKLSGSFMDTFPDAKSPSLKFLNKVFKYISPNIFPGNLCNEDEVTSFPMYSYQKFLNFHSSNTNKSLSIKDFSWIFPDPVSSLRFKKFQDKFPWTTQDGRIEMVYLLLALSLHCPADILPTNSQETSGFPLKDQADDILLTNSQETSGFPLKDQATPNVFKRVIPIMKNPGDEAILQHFTTDFLVVLFDNLSFSNETYFKHFSNIPEAQLSHIFMNSGTLSPVEQKTTNLLEKGAHRASNMRQDNSISVHGRKLVNIEQKIDYFSLSLAELVQELINLFNQCRITLFNDLAALKASKKTYDDIKDISNYGILWDSFQIVIFEIKIFNLYQYYERWNCQCNTLHNIPFDTFRRIQIIPVSQDDIYSGFRKFLLSPGFKKNVDLRKIIADVNPMYNVPYIPISALTLKKADPLKLQIPTSISVHFVNYHCFTLRKNQKEEFLFSIIKSIVVDRAISSNAEVTNNIAPNSAFTLDSDEYSGSTSFSTTHTGFNASIDSSNAEVTSTGLTSALTDIGTEDSNTDFQLLVTPLLRKESDRIKKNRGFEKDPNYYSCSLAYNGIDVRLFVKQANKMFCGSLKLYPFIKAAGKSQSTILKTIFGDISSQDLPAKPLYAFNDSHEINQQRSSLNESAWYEFSHYTSPLFYDLGNRETTFDISCVNYQKITNDGRSWDSHWKLVNMLLHQVNQLHNKDILHNDINHFNVIIRSLKKGIDVHFPETMKILCDHVWYQIVLVDFDFISKKPPLNPSTVKGPKIPPPYKGWYSLLKEDGNPNFPSVSNDYYGILRSILCFQQEKCIFADQNTSSEEFAKVEFAAVKKGLASWISSKEQQIPEQLKDIFKTMTST